MVMTKFTSRVDRLVEKIKMSATPVPGFIIGLSGTDSVVAFLMMVDACRRLDMAHRVYGIHYTHAKRTAPSWFEEQVIPWLRSEAPEARIEVQSPVGGFTDQTRWADLHLRALHPFVNGSPLGILFEGQNYWVVGTINATERALGTYSRFADTASVQPLHTLNKSTILAICEEIGVPRIAIEFARQPDCFCGRDELAARNIELIDAILDHTIEIRPENAGLINTLTTYVHNMKADNGFKQRIPYIL